MMRQARLEVAGVIMLVLVSFDPWLNAAVECCWHSGHSCWVVIFRVRTCAPCHRMRTPFENSARTGLAQLDR
eukprot:1590952-Amphidinium_carterae.1